MDKVEQLKKISEQILTGELDEQIADIEEHIILMERAVIIRKDQLKKNNLSK